MFRNMLKCIQIFNRGFGIGIIGQYFNRSKIEDTNNSTPTIVNTTNNININAGDTLHILEDILEARRGHKYNNPAKKPQMFLKPCFDDLKPKSST